MKTILVPFKSLFTRRPHRNASFHFVTCDFYSFIMKVGVVGHCLINTNWMLCLHSRSNKIPCSERVFFKIHMKSPPLRALESCIYIYQNVLVPSRASYLRFLYWLAQSRPQKDARAGDRPGWTLHSREEAPPWFWFRSKTAWGRHSHNWFLVRWSCWPRHHPSSSALSAAAHLKRGNVMYDLTVSLAVGTIIISIL